MHIYIETDSLLHKAENIRDTANALQENMKRIESFIINLDTVWKGEAGSAYIAKILFVKKQFEVLYDFITEYAEVIESIVQDYENTEQQIAFKMES